MAVSGFTGVEVTPPEIVQMIESYGKETNTVDGGVQTVASNAAIKYGLTYSKVTNNQESINNALDAGNVVIFSISNNGIYTGGGHFIMCVGRDGDNYYVLESSTCYTTDRAYTYNQVFETVKYDRIISLGN